MYESVGIGICKWVVFCFYCRWKLRIFFLIGYVCKSINVNDFFNDWIRVFIVGYKDRRFVLYCF